MLTRRRRGAAAADHIQGDVVESRIGSFQRYQEACNWARVLAREHLEEIRVGRDADGWGLFVNESLACLFEGWEERHLSNEHLIGPDPRWSENEPIQSDADYETDFRAKY